MRRRQGLPWRWVWLLCACCLLVIAVFGQETFWSLVAWGWFVLVAGSPLYAVLYHLAQARRSERMARAYMAARRAEQVSPDWSADEEARTGAAAGK